jgi:septal ring factor EnvC (AmiA/AmiB activator)
MDKFLDILGTAGYPSGIVGIVLMLLFYLRKQESGVRTDINGSLQRLTAEVIDLKEEADELKSDIREKEAEIDTLRRERREAEDREDKQRRRADAAEAKLGVTDAGIA